MSRQAEWGLGPSEFIKRMPQSYAMVCKEQAKSQPESAKSASVLKVTEGLKICSITQTAYPAEKPKCAIPHKEEVEAKARTTIERLLERSQPSEEIPKLRARRAKMLEEDADGIEDRAREIDAVRRRKRHSEEEKEALRDEASRLRVEAARLRTIIRQLLN